MNDYLNNKNADYIEELSKREEMSKWREEIKKDANKFYQFCVHYDLIPNIFVLHEVCASWSTDCFGPPKEALLFDTNLLSSSSYFSGSTGRLL